jgi:hypothetical protein
MVARATFSEAQENVVDNGDGTYSRVLGGSAPVGGSFGTTGIAIVGRDANSVTARPIRAGLYGDVYTEGGGAVSRLASSAASNNATNMKSSPGKMFAVLGFNAKVTAVWVKFFNKASLPTVGTDLPFISFYCAGNAPFIFTFPNGIQFSTGVGYCIVTGAPELDNTAVLAADVLNLNILYT